MTVYSKESRVDAPLDEVWAFHGRIEGLVALTPDFLGLRVEEVRGESDPLTVGTEVRLSVRPFGVGPRQAWTSRIVERRREESRAVLRDEMVDGPFERWTHTHEFVADGDATVLRDRVAYRLPGGPVGPLASALAWPGLALAFRYRHRKTRELLEGPRRSRT